MRYLEILPELPSFAQEHINHLSVRNKSVNTCKTYTYELRKFFEYLCEKKSGFPDLPRTITLDMFKTLEVEDLEAYLSYSKNTLKNKERAIAKKQASIRSLFSYLFKRDKISKDIASKLDSIKITKSIPKALEREEAKILEATLRSGDGLSETQMRYYNYTEKRDFAIFLVLLTTGLRLFELCELNISDILFFQKQIQFIGKGGDEYTIPLNDHVLQALRDYIESERPRLLKKLQANRSNIEKAKLSEPTYDEDALFLSLQGHRISNRAVENLVKKYMKILKAMGCKTDGFSTHKMRSTVATWLLEETNDIKRVKDFLRHRHISTTEIYVRTKREELRQTAKFLDFGKN